MAHSWSIVAWTPIALPGIRHDEELSQFRTQRLVFDLVMHLTQQADYVNLYDVWFGASDDLLATGEQADPVVGVVHLSQRSSELDQCTSQLLFHLALSRWFSSKVSLSSDECSLAAGRGIEYNTHGKG